MAEGSETPNGERGHGPEARAPRGEGDLLAERRARRAAESGEIALTRRAEAAEATVQTLERHVASLQQRLREAEDERRRIDEQLEAQRTEALEREHELRSVKQREYAEQQLRVEVEERLLALERESRAEIDGLGSRLSAREREARDLAVRLEAVQHQLAEAERAAARPRAASAAEGGMQARLDELERRAAEIERRLDAERAARERSERLLQSMREGHRRMEALVAEMKHIVARVSSALVRDTRPVANDPVGRLADKERGPEMTDALAAAVERLRARADAAQPAAERAAAPPQPAATMPTHRHALSWFGRRKIKRKQRRTP